MGCNLGEILAKNLSVNFLLFGSVVFCFFGFASEESFDVFPGHAGFNK